MRIVSAIHEVGKCDPLFLPLLERLAEPADEGMFEYQGYLITTRPIAKSIEGDPHPRASTKVEGLIFCHVQFARFSARP